MTLMLRRSPPNDHIVMGVGKIIAQPVARRPQEVRGRQRQPQRLYFLGRQQSARRLGLRYRR